ncbi:MULTISPECIES: aspartate ammonia-lyase [unclassified Pseudodesulfovibrio]|uniref:aspartate ammonia-lyase n=1 Tax=unclassified Pseudodesulfovibrio TaxID=2661612 RepID=UPI000FEB73F0|nr:MULTISPECIES: aspartate ammonia-lyase [unclassified Pseudodesulfovibrio]MCJ2165026.1 aspartate ammonia-lyase [Pseudodesulfovibrio sp. S3-i]RWU03533.1 aspartate ammonia-lyase [Pseudodesulfovibrio sp. S3]
MGQYRHEHDSLGEAEVPASAYYGVQTMRALDNFHISGITMAHYPRMINALAYVKMAAAEANASLGMLDEDKSRAIVRACEEILDGKLHDQFVVDVMQGGAGTSANMNANEVICNRALELMGHEKGQYDKLHPLNDVNMSQSTNDVYPSALNIALILDIRELVDAMDYLRKALKRKGEEFSDVLKMGRTQLQDAVPMTLGQEFSAWSVMVGEDMQRLDEAQALVHEINMGATAIGTGLNAHPDYTRTVTEKLVKSTTLQLISAPDLVEATQDTGVYVQLSGVLKRVAVKISKICNDLRLLSSGPRCGLNEINLPPMQPGSSIMPGKVNPVIPEVVNQVAFTVIGHDVTVTMACEAGQLELNVMEPVIGYSLFQSMNMLRRACLTLADKCVSGITANREHCREMVENSIGLVTALNPFIGYEKSAEIAKEAMATGGSVYEIVLAKGYLSQEELDDILKPENMVKPRYIKRS